MLARSITTEWIEVLINSHLQGRKYAYDYFQ